MDIRQEYLDQVRSQEESGALYPDYVSNIRRALTEFSNVLPTDLERGIGSNEEAIRDITQGQVYLKDVVVREQWDCESVLSTYSTLDNHPTLLEVIVFTSFFSSFTINMLTLFPCTPRIQSPSSSPMCPDTSAHGNSSWTRTWAVVSEA